MSGQGDATAAEEEAEDEEEHVCSICLQRLNDDALYDEYGESLQTACGHRFHAVCFARLLETPSEHEPVCPMCRSTNLAVRFGTAA